MLLYSNRLAKQMAWLLLGWQRIAVPLVAPRQLFQTRNLAVCAVARILATGPYLSFVVGITEVILTLDRRPPLLLHSDYCQTFANAVWHVQRMPSHPELLIVTTNYHRMVETVHSYVAQAIEHRLDLCWRGEKKTKQMRQKWVSLNSNWFFCIARTEFLF